MLKEYREGKLNLEKKKKYNPKDVQFLKMEKPIVKKEEDDEKNNLLLDKEENKMENTMI